jgi:uncharacterized protein YndB with AHSA1/START domain
MDASVKSSSAIEVTPRGLLITRVFDAPRALVFQAWTKPEHLAHWWGQPKGAAMPYCKVDLRIGGTLHYRVQLPEGEIIWGKGIYQEIVEPERLVFSDFFSDEEGNIVDPPPGLPKETLVIATFEEHDGKTKVTVEHRGVEQASEHNQALYQQGWAESLDRLAERLASI